MTILSLAASFVLGVVIAVRLDIPAPAAALLLLASVLVLLLLLSSHRRTMVALALIALVLGLLRVTLSREDPTLGLAAYHGVPTVRVQGVVVEEPDTLGTIARFRLRVNRIGDSSNRDAISGDVLVSYGRFGQIAPERAWPYVQYGDLLEIEGALEAPPELDEFDYPAYLARQGIGSVMSFPEITLIDEDQGVLFYRGLNGMRGRLADSLERVIREPQASLGKALLLGIRDDIPEDLTDEFRVTGTSHVLAISGLHVGILLGMSLGASAWVLGRRRQLYLLAPLALIWAYALMSGMTPSATRASIMGSVYLAALLLGRPRSILPALGLAAAFMVAIDPNVVESVSFQLSFAAMAGIALMAGPLRDTMQRLYSDRIDPANPLTRVLDALSFTSAMTIAATIATLPLVAFYFQRVSLIGLPTTALALPALPPILVTQAAAGLVGLASTTLAQPLGWLAWLATAYLTGVVGLAARLPGASFETGDNGPFFVWLYYAALAALWVGGSVRGPLRRWLSSVSDLTQPLPRVSGPVSRWLLALIASAVALVWIAALSLGDDRLRVSFLDVGQGDATFIVTPGGQQILVDGGPDGDRLVHLVGERMPFMDRTIELVVLTHAHSDHVNGLIELLRRYDVKHILERRTGFDSPQYDAWRRAVEEEGAEVTQASAGQVIAMGDGVFLSVVSPADKLLAGTRSDVDNASVVVRLVYGDISFLLTGDVFGEGESALLDSGANIDSDVLKVGHHGSRSSSSGAFLEAVSPAIAIISAGEDNLFGHPHPETLEALAEWVPDDGLFLTKDRGVIEFISDGRRLLVKTER
jgi:competence protein ComEC